MTSEMERQAGSGTKVRRQRHPEFAPNPLIKEKKFIMGSEIHEIFGLTKSRLVEDLERGQSTYRIYEVYELTLADSVPALADRLPTVSLEDLELDGRQIVAEVYVQDGEVVVFEGRAPPLFGL